MWEAELSTSLEEVALEDILGMKSYENIDLSLLSYPINSPEIIRKRLEKLHELGVESTYLIPRGERRELLSVGKGNRGVVVLCKYRGTRAVAKVMRLDSAIKSFEHEAMMQKRANHINVGPRLFAWCDEIILMEFIDGERLDKWLEKHKNPKELRKILKNTFLECYRLDRSNLNHGQLSNALKHIIVRSVERPVIIDFSHSSLTLYPKNVTQMASFLQNLNIQLNNILFDSQEKLLTAVREYKRSYSEEALGKILKAAGLDI